MSVKLEVGRSYRNREGDEVKIVDTTVGCFTHLDSDGCGYKSNGDFRIDGTQCDFDLVEECEAEVPVEMTDRQRELDAYFCGSELRAKLPLCETILAEVEAAKAFANGDSNLAHAFMWKSAINEAEKAIRKHFATLTVEDVKRVLVANDGDTDDAAQAVMKLLRKE